MEINEQGRKLESSWRKNIEPTKDESTKEGPLKEDSEPWKETTQESDSRESSPRAQKRRERLTRFKRPRPRPLSKASSSYSEGMDDPSKRKMVLDSLVKDFVDELLKDSENDSKLFSGFEDDVDDDSYLGDFELTARTRKVPEWIKPDASPKARSFFFLSLINSLMIFVL